MYSKRIGVLFLFVSLFTHLYAEDVLQYTPLLEDIIFERPLRNVPETPPRVFWTPSYAENIPSISGIEDPLTISFIERYTKGGNKTWLLDALLRGGKYMAFIKSKLSEYELPPEFLYLPAIESAYMPNAVSRSGASGLWQFMKNSMSPWLNSTEWLDERFDFWASTEAALLKLKANYEETKDWALSLAAYNSGLGAIRSVIKKNPDKNYWELSAQKKLKSETISYVPKLLAVYYIASNPRRTGFENFWAETVEWARVTIGQQADLKVLAEISNLDVEELRAINTELRYNTTPPGNNYALKVRAKDKDALQKALAENELPLIRNYIHIVLQGDTIYALARKYGVSEAHIFEANPGVKASNLKIGYHLLIPALR